MVDKVSFDADMVRKLAELLDQTNLTEIEYESGSQRIRVVRRAGPSQVVHTDYAAHPQLTVPAAPLPAPAQGKEALSAVQGEALKSPMVGTAYLSSEPSSPPFVKEGDTISEGETLLIIEAMKVMNPIRAPKSGKLIKILVKDAAPVEFDEVLMLID